MNINRDFTTPSIENEYPMPVPSLPVPIAMPSLPVHIPMPSQDTKPPSRSYNWLDKFLRDRPGLRCPIPIHTDVLIPVESVLMSPFFGHLHEDICNALSLSSNCGIISREHWILVCRYLTKARCDLFCPAHDPRFINITAIPQFLEVPKALADVINGIGKVKVLSGAFSVVPAPEQTPDQPSSRLEFIVTINMLDAFTSLIVAAKSRRLIQVATIGDQTEGTAWWAISARDSTNQDKVANQSDSVIIKSAFREFTPTDALMCAIVQRQNDGHLPGASADVWTSNTITGTISIRHMFCLKA